MIYEAALVLERLRKRSYEVLSHFVKPLLFSHDRNPAMPINAIVRLISASMLKLGNGTGRPRSVDAHVMSGPST
jgi:hypothetical protein